MLRGYCPPVNSTREVSDRAGNVLIISFNFMLKLLKRVIVYKHDVALSSIQSLNLSGFEHVKETTFSVTLPKRARVTSRCYQGHTTGTKLQSPIGVTTLYSLSERSHSFREKAKVKALKCSAHSDKCHWSNEH